MRRRLSCGRTATYTPGWLGNHARVGAFFLLARSTCQSGDATVPSQRILHITKSVIESQRAGHSSAVQKGCIGLRSGVIVSRWCGSGPGESRLAPSFLHKKPQQPEYKCSRLKLILSDRCPYLTSLLPFSPPSPHLIPLLPALRTPTGSPSIPDCMSLRCAA